MIFVSRRSCQKMQCFDYLKEVLVDNGSEFDNGNFRDFLENLILLEPILQNGQTLKQFVASLPTNCLSVFDHFVGLALKGINVRIKTRTAESAWVSGLVERHNAIIVEAVNKCSLDMQVLSAKNSLQNVHGFSPTQLDFG